MKFTIKFIVITLGCIGLIFIGLMWCALWTSDYKITLHTAKIAWLPANAYDVSHKVRIGLGAVEMIECTMPENDFLALAEENKWEIASESNFSVDTRIGELPRLREFTNIGPMDIVLRGYKYELRHPNNGGITVCYDLDLQRMIYSKSHR